MIIKLPLLCRSKKNSQSILKNHKTGKYFISQSELYKNFEKECGLYLQPYKNLSIDVPINFKATFIVPDRRKRDLTNLLNAIQDVLVKYKVLEDDNYNIINGLDGSRIIYDKGKSETIVEITKMKK